jgi:tellurite resistance protein TerC
MQAHELAFWIGFNVFVVVALALDLGVLHRHARVIRFREALLTSLVWVSLAGAFAIGVYFWVGRTSALEFVTGYVVEQSLSVDNLFVFLMIFRYFRVDPAHQHKVLFWGILGALIMRAVFILVGIGLIARFHWIIYLFGAWLVYTGARLAFAGESEVHPEANPLIRWLRRWMPITPDYVGDRFFVRRDGLWATPLLIVLIVVETTDVLFATDSIPAILAISRNPFVVYTSNVFAILGLRSLYFALAGMMELFAYLSYGLSVVLVFIGIKMLLSSHVAIPTAVALGVVAGVLLISIGLSVMFPPKEKEVTPNPAGHNKNEK